MIKAIFCLRRLPELTFQEFQDHWYHVHAQFITRTKRLRRYVQYHALVDDPSTNHAPKAEMGSVEPFDGFAVCWFDRIEDMFAPTHYQSEGIEDDKVIIGLERSVLCITREDFIIEPEGIVEPKDLTPYVFIECLRRGPELERNRFKKAWLDHGEFFRHAHSRGRLKGYIQSHTLPSKDMPPEGFGLKVEPFDGVAFSYFDSIADFKKNAPELNSTESIEAGQKFIDHSGSVCQLTRRHVFKEVVR
jgi:hypothetical protein